MLNGLTAVFSLLAAWAWMKSALLATRWRKQKSFLDDAMNWISQDPVTWNAIAAILAACAAVCQGIEYISRAAHS